MIYGSSPLHYKILVWFAFFQINLIPLSLPLLLKIVIKVNQKTGEAPIIEADIIP